MIKNKIAAAKSALINNKEELITLAVASATLTVSSIIIVKLTPTTDEQSTSDQIAN